MLVFSSLFKLFCMYHDLNDLEAFLHASLRLLPFLSICRHPFVRYVRPTEILKTPLFLGCHSPWLPIVSNRHSVCLFLYTQHCSFNDSTHARARLIVQKLKLKNGDVETKASVPSSGLSTTATYPSHSQV